ncbi:hypothetical protein VTK73DRAFT_10034 [Phialemonium thermophilum]|uniref:Zn(2)-C6 fungal-type domain-containing protein n=1 Tax=Phialemonium thermophilum TaxID=223376 RepID=A0ABR3XHP0_9PEZI
MPETSSVVSDGRRSLLHPCNLCRARHQKCDDRRPSCSNCRKNGSECVRSYNVRFRHALNPSVRRRRASAPERPECEFADDQPWVETGSTLTFIDETKDVVASNGVDKESALAHVDEEDEVGPVDVRPSSSSLSGASPLPTDSFSPCPLDGTGNSGVASHASYTHPSPESSQRSTVPPITYLENRIDTPGSYLERTPPNEGVPSTSKLDVVGGDLLRSPAAYETTFLERQTATILGSWDSDHTAADPLVSLRDAVAAAQDKLIDRSNADGLRYDGSAPKPSATVTGSLESHLASPSPSLSIYVDKPQWPLEDPQQAFLFRHYVENIGNFLDLCDQGRRHFTTVVPFRAAVCPLLLNAILAASAKRLSRISNFDPLVVDQYHHICLRLLIPYLSTSDAVVDENLLTAIIILRFMEEMDVPVSQSGPESHLMGTRVFLSSQKEGTLCKPGGLRLAAFWVALRQEIYMAFVHVRAVHENFDLDKMSELIEDDENGCGFANRIIIHTAHCLRFCYGTETQNVVREWEALKAEQDRLWSERPWYFGPVWFDNSESFLPREMYINDAVVTGVQHYHLARILLTAHNPTMPKLGPGQFAAAKAMDQEIKEAVRVICGIAESNPRTAPAYVSACISISMAGDRFTERHEQEVLYEILRKTHEEMAWPTRSAQISMRSAWGWEGSPVPSHSTMSISGILNRGTVYTS